MGQKDISEKLLTEYNDVFADIVNVLLFEGENVIHENELQSTKDTSQYKADGRLHEQERDLSKIWQKCNVKIAFYGIENQTVIDNYMPLRVIGYDGAAYRSQYNGIDTKAYPVITIVLNFSKAKWERNKKLSDVVTIPEELLPYFNDYSINVFDIAFLSHEQVSMFKSDFRIVADYFVQTKQNKKYVPTKDTIKHVDEVLKLLSVLTEDNRFAEVQNSERKVTNMCEVLNEIEARGEAKGEVRGEVKVLYLRLKMTPEEIADDIQLSVEEVRSIIAEIESK